MLELAASFFKVSTKDLVEDGSFSESRFKVDVDSGTASSGSLFQVETVGSGPLALGIPTTRQEAWLVVAHGGTSRYDGEFPTGLEISFAAEGTTFVLPTHGYEGDEVSGTQTLAWHGRAIDRGAAPPGSDVIDISMSVQFPGITAPVSYPLVTGARVWGSTEPLIGRSPVVLRGGDYLSRFQGIEVEYDKPIGAEAYAGQIIDALLFAAGMPASRIAVSATLGEPIAKLIEARCVDAVGESRDIAEAVAHVLVTDGEGNAVTRHIAPIEEEPVAEIDIAHLETGELAAELVAETQGVPRCWEIMGSRPEIPEDAEGFVTIRRKEAEVVEPYTVPAVFGQDSAGAITSAKAAVTENRITSQLFVVETFYQGCLIRRVRETWGQYNPEKQRYETTGPSGSADGEPRAYVNTAIAGGYVFGTGVVKDDSNPMRVWYDFKLCPISFETTDFIRNSTDTFSGVLVQLVESTSEWRSIEAAWKFNTTDATPWSDEVVIPTTAFFGGGRPIGQVGGSNEEHWFAGPNGPLVSLGGDTDTGSLSTFTNIEGAPSDMKTVLKYAGQTVTDITVALVDAGDGRDTYFETRRVATLDGYGRDATEGDNYQYKNGDIRGGQYAIGVRKRVTTENYVPDGEATHAKSTLEVDGKNRFVRATTESGQPSYLPIADVCNDELQALASTVDVSGKCCIESAAGDYVDRIERETTEWIETAAFAHSVACAKLRERAAFTATVTMPMTPVFHHKAPVKFTALHKGIDPDDWDEPSNAWIEDPVLTVVREDSGLRKLCTMNIRIRAN